MDKRRWVVNGILIVCLLVLGACTPAQTTSAPTQGTAPTQAPPAQPEQPTQPPAAAATPTEEMQEEPAAEDPVTFVIATDTDLQPGLDIHDAASFQTGQTLGMQVFDTLIQLGPEGYEPRLAESWEITEDSWIFHLRQDVTFHDGTPFNAEAVKANVDRLITSELRQTSKWSAVESAEVVDEYTVRIISKEQPSLAFFGQLVHAAGGAMQSPTAMENNEFPVGTGPFRFVEWKQNEELVLEKNPDYWMDGPFIDNLIIRVVPDAAARTLMLESGEADFVMYVPPVDALSLTNNPDFTVLSPRNPGWRYIGMNTQKEPFTDVRVRQALNYAVDKQAISDSIFFEFARPLTSPLGSGMWGHTDVGDYAYDPDRARELLAEAGYPNGFDATFITASNRPAEALAVAQAVQGYLSQVGVNAEITVLDFAIQLETMYTPLESNTVELFSASYGGADPDTLRIELGCDEWPPNRNAAFYCNEQVEELFNQGMFETDQEQRRAIYAELQSVVWEDAPWIFLTELTWIGAYRSTIQDFVMYEGNQNYYDLRWIKKTQ